MGCYPAYRIKDPIEIAKEKVINKPLTRYDKHVLLKQENERRYRYYYTDSFRGFDSIRTGRAI